MIMFVYAIGLLDNELGRAEERGCVSFNIQKV